MAKRRITGTHTKPPQSTPPSAPGTAASGPANASASTSSPETAPKKTPRKASGGGGSGGGASGGRDKGQRRLPTCGIIMPISAMGDYPESHWQHLQEIIKEAADAAGFHAKMVSDSSAIGTIIIHKEIVKNIYHDEICICVISGRNPNVMFELGLRCAFNKPVIILEDGEGRTPFDLGPMKYFSYPKTLSYYAVLDLIEQLKDAIPSTIDIYKEKRGETYLGTFGDSLTPQTLENKNVDVVKYMQDGFAVMQRSIETMIKAQRGNAGTSQEVDERIRAAPDQLQRVGMVQFLRDGKRRVVPSEYVRSIVATEAIRLSKGKPGTTRTDLTHLLRKYIDERFGMPATQTSVDFILDLVEYCARSLKQGTTMF